MERWPFWAQNTWRCWQMQGNYSTYANMGMLICTNEGKAMQQKYVKAYGCWYTAHQTNLWMLQGKHKTKSNILVILYGWFFFSWQ